MQTPPPVGDSSVMSTQAPVGTQEPLLPPLALQQPDAEGPQWQPRARLRPPSPQQAVPHVPLPGVIERPPPAAQQLDLMQVARAAARGTATGSGNLAAALASHLHSAPAAP